MTKEDIHDEIMRVDNEYKKLSQDINDMKRDLNKLEKIKKGYEDNLYRLNVAYELLKNSS